MCDSEELPFQTYERITGQKWPGGNSKIVRLLLKLFKIPFAPGSLQANIALQQNLYRYDYQ